MELAEKEVDIASSDGLINSLIVHPHESGKRFPVVIFYMDAPGRRKELDDMARKIAQEGYYVVLPNLYYRNVRHFYMTSGEEGLKEMNRMLATLSNQLVASDTEHLLRYIDSDVSADKERIASAGYCMGGPFALAAAAKFPHRFRAVASIHGAPMVTSAIDSPHHLVHSIGAELYFACAENDKFATAEDIAILEEQLKISGSRYHLEWYAQAEHGFVFPSRKTYCKEGALRHWEQLFKLFARTLNS